VQLKLRARLVTGVFSVLVAAPASAQIPRDQYLKYVPLTYPTLVRETEASRRFQLYGRPDDPAYRDASPRDGVDDARAAWLNALGVRFAPLLVRNTAYAPTDFRAFTRRPGFAINVDTWDLAREEAAFLDHTELRLADITERPCAPGVGAGDDCQLLRLVETFGPRRGSIEPEVTVGAEQARFTVMYFDFPGYDQDTWKQAYVAPGREAMSDLLAGTERVFVHPFIAEASSGDEHAPGYELVLQYWFFYPVNDGPNNHEGDWEHINVIVSPMSTVARPLDAGEVDALLAEMPAGDGDDPLVIRRLEYYFHHYVYPMDFAAPNAYQPRGDWDRQVAALARGTHGERWLWDRIRERAWQDEAETRVNTRPVVWIGGDAVGIQSVLEMPGLKDRDGHPSYPFRGYYTQIGPGVGERVMRAFDFRDYYERPSEVPGYVEDYGRADRVALLPDWERLIDPVLTDPAARRDWAWFLLPLRFGYPASPSPAAGVISHMDTGNVSVVGPSFNGGWNRTGAASGYALYEAARLSWASPLSVADSFFPRAGFLNAPILYFMIKPPLDLVWRTLALPVRAAVGSRQPTFRPANAPARRLASFEVGTAVSPISQDFTAAFLNRDQFVELVVRLALALPDGATDLQAEPRLGTVATPAYSIVFHLSPHFSTESTLASYSARVGFDVTSAGGTPPIEVRATLEQFDYQGNLRFNLRTGSVQPYLKYGTGITWYQLKNVSVAGDVLLTADSPRFKPKGNWWSLGFNELLLGGGVDVSGVRLGRTWLGVKVGYTAIHHQLGFERDAAVEYSPDLAKKLAGTTFSVWRHQVLAVGTLSF